MKMNRRSFPLLCLTALLAAACDKEPAEQPLETECIRFAAPTLSLDAANDATRSTLYGSTADLGDGFAFDVLGYCVPYDPAQIAAGERSWQEGTAVWSSKKRFSYPDVFGPTYRRTVTYRSGICTYAPLQRWYRTEDLPEAARPNVDPENYNYTFFAFHPTSMELPSGNAAGAPQLRYSLPFEAGTEETPRDHTRIDDAMVAAVYDYQRTRGDVQLTFKHILSALQFRVNNYNDKGEESDTNAIRITSIELSGTFHRTATIDFAQASNVADPAIAVSDSFSGRFALLPDGEARTVRPNQSELVSAPLLLLPDDSDLGSGLRLTLKYDKCGADGRWVQNDYEGRFDTMFAGTPMRGVRYTFHLNFLGNKLVIMATIDNNDYWDGSDNDITIN